MDSKRANISQIQKYLNGELDAKAMHQLEREAQHDPFLMDALEGYDLAKGNQQHNLDGLQARLNGRTAAKTRRLMPWTVVAAAAAVIGFAVIVGVWYNNNPSPAKQQVALNESVKQKKADTTALLYNVPKVSAPEQQVAVLPKAAPVKPIDDLVFKGRMKAAASLAPVSGAEMSPPANIQPVADSSASLDDMVVGYMAANKKTDSIVLGGDKVATTNNASALTVLKSKAEGAMMKPSQSSQNNAYAMAKANLPPGLVTGVVLDRMDGSPLPGVSVKIVGKPSGTQTDVNGKFALPNVKKDENLSFGYFGYGTKTLALQGKDSLKVELDGNTNALSEVVVTNSQKAEGSTPHPEIGWDKFKKYLKDNALSADGKEGTVELVFVVLPDNSVNYIKVVKGLSPDADKKAINLIQNGPKWVGVAKQEGQYVKVKVPFHK